MLQLPDVHAWEGRTERERRFQERERTKGRGRCCLSEALRPPGPGRQPSNAVMLKQGVQVATCHPWAAAFHGPRGAQILSPEGDGPHVGRCKICCQPGFLASLIRGQMKHSGEASCAPAAEGVRGTQDRFPWALPTHFQSLGLLRPKAGLL